MLALANKLSLNTRPIYRFVNEHSVDFDGVDDRIVTDGADTVAQPTTYSFWCKASTTSSNVGVFGHGEYRQGAFHFNYDADRPLLYLGTDYFVYWNDTSAQDDGEWHHWVVYLDPNNLNNCKLYVDGVLQTVNTVRTTGSLDAYTESLTIGSERQSGGNSFEGKIDEFAVYDRELTQAEITKIYNSGKPINLNLNAGAYQSANPLITSTKSMEFDGTDDFLKVEDSSNLRGMAALTVCCWVKFDTKSNYAKVLDYSSTSGNSQRKYRIQLDSSTDQKISFLIANTSDSTSIVTSAGAMPTDRWVHLVGTFDNSLSANRQSFYIDGVLDNTATAFTETINNDDSGFLSFGENTYGSNNFDGQTTEAGIYNRCLTALEVASLYNQGMPTNLLVNRNNYQSGNPTVFNTKQVDFDGTDDYLKVTNNYGSFTGSISMWFKRDNTGNPMYLIDARGDSVGGTGYIVVNSSVFTVSSGTRYVDGVAKTTMPTDANWHHIVVTGMTLDIDVDLKIGSRYNQTEELEGNISQVGLFNSTLTSDEVSSLYNHGLPIDLTTDQAAYESSSNLVGYWRMGSGTLDTYPLIADQTNATLGSEQVTNGDFATDSDWTLSANAVISGGNLTLTANSANISATQNIGTQDSKVLKLEYTVISNDTTGGLFRVGGLSGSSIAPVPTNLSTSIGTNTVYINVSSSGTNTVLDLYLTTSNTSGSLVLDNISVKQVNGNPAIMTNQTSSDIENGSPYADLVTNGTFDTDSDWTLATGWSIANGKLVGNGSMSASANAEQDCGFVNGNTYKFTFEITERTQGSVYIRQPFNGSADAVNEVGTHTFNYVAGSDTRLVFRSADGFAGSIDNVTVEEVNTGLQGYWKMGDGTNDEYPVIYDQTNPTLGSELVTNGDFATDLSGWTNANNHWQWTSQGAYFPETTTHNPLAQILSNNSNVILKLTFTLNVVKGTANVFYLDASSGTVSTQYTTSGTYTLYTVPVKVNTSINFSRYGGINTEFYVDNVSVKQVQGNPATMTNMVEGNITNQYPLTKIRNYYRMGDGILDGYPIIQDQTSPNLAHIPTTNLIEYSEDFSPTYWTKNYLTATESSVVSPISQSNTFLIQETTYSTALPSLQLQTGLSVSAGTFNATFYVKNNSGRYLGISFGSSSERIRTNFDFNTETFKTPIFTGTTAGTASFTKSGDFYRISINATFPSSIAAVLVIMPLATDTYPYYANQDSDNRAFYIWGSQVEQQSQPTTYLKSDGIAAVRKSSTTNLVNYSEDFSNSYWTKSGASVTSGFVSPDGTANAYKLVEDSANSRHFINSTGFSTPDTVYSASLFVKANGRSKIAFRENSITGNYASFNLSNGTVIETNGVSASIELISNDWYRINYQITSGGSYILGIELLSDSYTSGDPYSNPYQGDGSSGVYIYGSQVEFQTQAETYAKTTGLPVTIDLFTENNYGTMTNMSASDIVEDTP